MKRKEKRAISCCVSYTLEEHNLTVGPGAQVACVRKAGSDPHLSLVHLICEEEKIVIKDQMNQRGTGCCQRTHLCPPPPKRLCGKEGSRLEIKAKWSHGLELRDKPRLQMFPVKDIPLDLP